MVDGSAGLVYCSPTVSRSTPLPCRQRQDCDDADQDSKGIFNALCCTALIVD